MGKFVQTDREGRVFLNLDNCLMIEQIDHLFYPENNSYKITTNAGKEVIVRTHVNLKDKIK